MELRQKRGGCGPSGPFPSGEIPPKPIYALAPLNASDETILAEIEELNQQMDEKSYEKNTQIARKSKNLEFTRFRVNNFPYDKTLVPLCSKRFINASFVFGNKFIATQSPMPNTCEDFWTMVLEQRACSVIMLNRIGDPGDDIYFPLTMNDRKRYGNIRLELTEAPLFKTDSTWRQPPHEEEPHAIIHRKVKVWKKDQQVHHIVHHFQYQNWLDLSAGNERAAAHLVQMVNPIRAGGRPVVIHCHAGIGRTGVMIALLEQTAQLQQGGNFALKQLVERQRSPQEGRCHSMMQVPDQYHFCYRTLRVLFPHQVIDKKG
jgi:tyrosine-protein phosphatase non-receptor type 3